MLQVTVESRGNCGASQTDSQPESGRKSGAVSSKQLVDVIMKVRVEDVFTNDPVRKEPDDPRLYHHQELDGAWSDRPYCAPRPTQSAIGLYADDVRGSGRAFEKIVSLLGVPGERNLMEYGLAVAGRLLAR